MRKEYFISFDRPKIKQNNNIDNTFVGNNDTKKIRGFIVFQSKDDASGLFK